MRWTVGTFPSGTLRMPKGNGFKSVELMNSSNRLRCPHHPVQKIKAHISSHGFSEKQQVRREDKCGPPWTGSLLSDVIRTPNYKMVVKTEYQGSRHGDCQADQAEPFLRCPQKNHGEQGTQKNYADHEEHGSRAQLHAQFAVSRSVDDIDHQVREHKSSSVFDCAIHRLFM